jgi:hypothetical protein
MIETLHNITGYFDNAAFRIRAKLKSDEEQVLKEATLLLNRLRDLNKTPEPAPKQSTVKWNTRKPHSGDGLIIAVIPISHSGGPFQDQHYIVRVDATTDDLLDCGDSDIGLRADDVVRWIKYPAAFFDKKATGIQFSNIG